MTASVSCCLPARGLPARPCSPPPASILQAGVVDGECASRGCVGWDGLGRAVVWPLLLTCAGGSPLDLDLGLAAILSKPSSLFSLFSQVTDHICKLAKKGLRPSQIGVVLRDSHGVAQVSAVTGSKVLRILKGQGLAPEIPEDLYFLIKKAVSMRKHLDSFRKDRDGKFRLILVESRIHRLARYYKRAKKLPPTWKYESATASALVS